MRADGGRRILPLILAAGALAITIVALAGSGATLPVDGPAAHDRGTTWFESSENPVLAPEDGRAYYPTVLPTADGYRAWFSGWSVGGFGLETATSPDGIHWSEPADASDGLQSSGFIAEHHAHVERIGDHYRIWYWDCCGRDDISVLRTATSDDGVTWTNDQPLQQVDGEVITGEPGSVWNRFGLGLEDVIYNPLGPDEIVEPDDPASAFQNKYVAYVGNSNGGQQFVGLAVSADGVTWEAYKDGADPVFGPSDGGWDATHVYPGTVVQAPDGYHMWYSGGDGDVSHGIGYAYSSDGVDWERADEPIFHVSDGEDWRTEETYTPTVLPATGQMWFTGETDGGDPGVGYAQGVPLPESPPTPPGP